MGNSNLRVDKNEMQRLLDERNVAVALLESRLFSLRAYSFLGAFRVGMACMGKGFSIRGGAGLCCQSPVFSNDSK